MTAAEWIDATGAGGRHESFYVPDFKVEAGPSTSALAEVGDVRQVTFKDGVNEIDAFDFTAATAEWAPDAHLHTVSFPTAPPPGDAPPSVLPGARVRLWLGYRSAPLFPMLTGRVVSVTPQYADGEGGTTISVRSLSTLEELRDREKSHRWRPERGGSTITDTDVARRIAQERDITFVSPSGLDEPGHRTIAQQDETDVAFLIRRARERGYIVCFREVATTGGPPERRMYFGPSHLLGAPERAALGDRVAPYELRWGASLVDFRPTLNLSTTRWRSVKLSFWDRRARHRDVLTYSIEDLWADEQNLNCDLKPMVDDAAVAEHELSNQAVHTRDEARALLRNKLRENFLGMVTAQGTTVGLPQLRACSQVEVTGLPPPLAGTWFVTSTTHTLGDNGYRTQFEARREQRGGSCP